MRHGARRATRSVVALVAGALLAGLALAGCTSQKPGVARIVSHRSLRATTTSDICRVPEGRLPGSSGAASVDPGPRDVRAVWYPGLNVADCTEPITRGGAALAEKLAADVRSATPWPKGRYSCARDSATGVRLFFDYPDSRTETVVVNLTGCPSIRPFGNGSALEPGRLLHDLVPVLPPGHAWDRFR